MNSFVKSLIQPLLEQEGQNIALVPGGFKPPTAGHLMVVEKVILDLWKNHIKESVITQIDAKTTLQELTLKNFKKLPVYKLISNTGPRHKPSFKVGVKLPNTKYFFGLGKSKKDAEQNAAIECLKSIK